MRLKCYFGFHNWKYQVENIEYKTLSKPNSSIFFNTNTRYCDLCYKKECNTITDKWRDYGNLTKDQKRDKSLSELGI